MPFDPKFVPEAEAPLAPDGEIELPEDLCALAEQLRIDATCLAKAYPVVERPQAPARSRRSRIAVLLTSAAAALLLAVAVTNMAALSRTPPEQPQVAADQGPQRPSGTETSEFHFTSLTGPEAEAAIDLSQRDSTTRMTVSF